MSQNQAKPAAKWRKSQIVGALVFLYTMRGESFEPEEMPRRVIAEMLGVDRSTVMRSLRDAKAALALARVLDKRLVEHAKLPKPKMGRPPKPKPAKEPKPDDLNFKTKGKRNRNMSMRPMRAGVGKSGGE